MAKRYLETGYYKSPFVRNLKGPLKALYNFIICDCDNAGIWVKDLMIASTYIGFEVTEKDFEVFVKSKKAWDLNNGKFFFPDFIEHQYPNGLSESNPALKKAINELRKYGLIDQQLKTLPRPSKDPYIGTKEEEEVKVVGKVDEVVILPNIEFEVFWELYDKKVGDQKKLRSKWYALSDMERTVIIDYIPSYKLAQPDKKYRKNPETFINNKSWRDEIILPLNSNNGKFNPKNQQQADVAQLGSSALRRLAETQNRNNAGGDTGSEFTNSLDTGS